MLGDGEGIDGRSGGCCWVWISVGGGESCGGGGRESCSVGESFENGGDGLDGGEFELVVGLREERKELRSAQAERPELRDAETHVGSNHLSLVLVQELPRVVVYLDL